MTVSYSGVSCDSVIFNLLPPSGQISLQLKGLPFYTVSESVSFELSVLCFEETFLSLAFVSTLMCFGAGSSSKPLLITQQSYRIAGAGTVVVGGV